MSFQDNSLFISKGFVIPWLLFNPAGDCLPPSRDHCQANTRCGFGCLWVLFWTVCEHPHTPWWVTHGDLVERQQTQLETCFCQVTEKSFFFFLFLKLIHPAKNVCVYRNYYYKLSYYHYILLNIYIYVYRYIYTKESGNY